MLLTATTTPVVILSTLLLSATAAPSRTRTHCRCTFVTDAPARTNWEDQPTTSGNTNNFLSKRSSAADICTELGPELENFRHSAPEQYDSFIRHSIVSPSPSEVLLRPIATTVLLDAAAHNGFQRSPPYQREHQEHGAARPTARPNQRIVCHAEAHAISAYQSSCVNYWVLEFIVFFSILACVAEGVQLGVRWMNQRHNNDAENCDPSPLRLSGDEKRLLAIPDPNLCASPGVEKETARL